MFGFVNRYNCVRACSCRHVSTHHITMLHFSRVLIRCWIIQDNFLYFCHSKTANLAPQLRTNLKLYPPSHTLCFQKERFLLFSFFLICLRHKLKKVKNCYIYFLFLDIVYITLHTCTVKIYSDIMPKGKAFYV